MTDARTTIQKMISDALPIRYGRVSAVGEDGTVNLEFGSSIIEQVPCSSGYPIRKIGDTVLVLRAPSGNWEVMFRSADTETAEYATLDDLEAAIDNLDADVTADLAGVATDIPGLAWGNGPPGGSGWVVATTTYFRDVGGGKREIYFDQSESAPPPTTKPPPPPTRTAPKSITLQPASRGSWRTSGQTDPDVWQGTWTSRGDWLGAWFYGDDIADACAGRSVASMSLRLSRVSGSIGWNRGIPVRLGLHDRQTKGKPPKSEGPRTPFNLEPNQTRDYTLPASWRNMLASGDMRGFFVTGSGRSQYIKYAGSAGRLVIRFNPS